MLEFFCWYLPIPSHWIRCTIVSRSLTSVSIVTYDGQQIKNLHVRKIYGAEFCVKGVA
jgi:hypothetical protein